MKMMVKKMMMVNKKLKLKLEMEKSMRKEKKKMNDRDDTKNIIEEVLRCENGKNRGAEVVQLVRESVGEMKKQN